MKKFIPDYKGEIDSVFVVSPLGLRDYLWEEFECFVSFLYEIIKLKNKNQKLIIICDSLDIVEQTKEKLHNTISDFNPIIEFEVCSVYDIWIRDYFVCANIQNEDNNVSAFRANYSPSYNPYAITDDAAGIVLAHKYFEDIYTLSLKLEGGNVICNDDFVFITEKIYTENYSITKSIIDKAFQDNFKQKLITLPTENLDIVGHTDGILRFLDNKTILLPIYDAEYKADNRYVMMIKKILTDNFGDIDYKFVFIPSYLNDEINDENIFSSKGVYINYFRFEDYLIFPSFEDSSYYEKEIVRIISKQDPNLKVYFSPCEKISFYGGCLNCITNVKYR